MDILASLQSIGFDWKLAIAHVVNFLIVFALLKHFLFDTISEKLSERRAKIKAGLAEAQEAQEHKEKAEEHYEKRVKEAQQEARLIMEGAQERGENVVAGARAEAQEEADQIVADAREKIARERAEMEAEIQEKMTGLVVAGVNKILTEKIDDAEGERIVGRGISGVNDPSHG